MSTAMAFVRATALTLLASVALAAPSAALSIEFVLTPIGVDSYRTEYRVVNDGSLAGGAAVLLFDLLFPTDLYLESSLVIATPNPPAADWDELLLASAPGVPAAYDALALGTGVLANSDVSGFAVEFTWLGGPAGPGPQQFEIVDPITFALLELGTTTPIPEPRTLLLTTLGLVSLAARARG
jgi:hypothetical protein